MSITKLKTLGQWGAVPTDLTRALGGRRVITGMLTGSDGSLASPAPPPVTRPGTPK